MLIRLNAIYVLHQLLFYKLEEKQSTLDNFIHLFFCYNFFLQSELFVKITIFRDNDISENR
ncbi:hypothetical protein BpHYR1_006690 [Brachionus plicatilis]|uniref:Uncharacterized protein n=1 Tax=Brachionus plicatilis TaxID=10195 RepID=A0A3M7S343_BRAPC|nr:hypothetical protein BpHYR1_006690 [Brachionus plicatilis]